MSENNLKGYVAITGIVCLTVIEIAAIYKGINGTLLSAVIGTIGTIVGFVFGRVYQRK